MRMLYLSCSPLTQRTILSASDPKGLDVETQATALVEQLTQFATFEELLEVVTRRCVG